MAVTVKQEVAALYSAIFNRAPDQAGLEFWVEAINGGDSLTKAAEGFTQHPVFAEVYGDLSNQAKVEALYTNVLGSAGDAAGIQFWVAKLESGVSFGQVVAEFVSGALTIDLDALLDSGELSQADYDAAVVRQNSITNKADAGVYFADTFGAASNLSASTDTTTKEGLESDPVYLASQAAIAGVTNDAATLAAAKAAIDAAEAPTDLNVAPAFTLTTGAETIAGTANADTIEGVASSLASARTLDAGDNIDGGEGADTINISMEGNFTGFTADVGGLKGVEVVNLTNEGTIARSFAAKGVEGVETYNLNGAVNLSDLASTDSAVNLADRASGTTTIAYATEVTNGTADALALGLANIGTVEVRNAAGTVTTAEAAVTVTAAGIEEVSITATGANVAALGSNDAKALAATGAGSLKLTAIGTGIKTLDAATLAGALDVSLADAAGVTSVVAGAGDDTVRAGAGDLANNAEVNGGEGADTLVLSGAINTVQYQMSGVETIELNAVTAMTFSATNTSGVESLVVKGAGNAATFANMGAADLAVTLSKDSAGAVTSDHAGTTTVSVSGGTKAAPTANTVDTTFTKSTAVDLTVAQYNSLTGDIDAAKAQSFTANIAGAVDNTISLAAATSAVFTQTNKDTTVDVVLDAAKVTDLQVTTAGVFTVDTDANGSDLSGVESLTVRAANHFIATGVALSSVASVELSGAGNDAQVTLGDLGAADVDYGITVNAEGLAAGLDIGNINTDVGQAVSVNVGGALGAVTVGDVTVDQTTAGGSISIDADGTVGAIELGTLAAKTVTVNAAGALSTVGAATAVAIDAETATFTGSALGANKVTVTADKAGTVVGGIAVDAITIISDSAANATATFTLTGGLGGDTFDITESAVGKTVVAITDFSAAAGDVLDINAMATVLTEAEAATFFGSAFGTTLTAADVFIKTVDTDTYYEIKGSAYLAIDAGTTGTFENGDLAIKLTGVTDLADAAGTVITA